MPVTLLTPSGNSKRIISPLPPMLFFPSAVPSPYLRIFGSAFSAADFFSFLVSVASAKTSTGRRAEEIDLFSAIAARPSGKAKQASAAARQQHDTEQRRGIIFDGFMIRSCL